MAHLPVGEQGQGVVGLDPTPGEAATIATIADALTWSGVAESTRLAFYEKIGVPSVLRDISYISRDEYIKYLELAQVKVAGAAAADAATSRPLQPTETARLWAFRRVCRLRCGLTPGDAAEVVTAQQQPFGSPGNSGPAALALPSDTQTIKLDQVLDPTLSAAIIQMDAVEIRKAYDQYVLRFGATPEDCIDPTLDQLSALKQIMAVNRSPYADFSRWGPWGKRLLRKLSLLAFTLLPNGLWQKTELGGPPTVEVWMDCWQVFRVAMLLLEACEAEILDLYASNIRALAARYGRECWFIVYTADQRMRAERWEKLRREADRAHAADPVNSKFDPSRPWNTIVQQSRSDADFWTQNVREPAALFLARARSARDVLDDGTNHPELPSPSQSTEPARNSTRPSLSEHQPRDAIANSSGDLSEKDGSGKFTVNKRGKPLCSRFGDGSCNHQKNTSCEQGTHQCPWCLSPGKHLAKDCPTRGGSPQAADGNKGSARNKPKGGGGKGKSWEKKRKW
jgi:hypothetical protein